MSLSNIPAGKNIPEEINVIIEIPSHAEPVKYEVDKETSAVFVDRFMATAMFYPCNYGYIPETLSDDGDPLDVLVTTPHALISGTVICCRPIGVLKMTDDSGEDAKLLAVPVDRLTPLYSNIKEVEDLSPLLINQIEHFFKHYKDLEPGKWVEIDGWGNAEAAKKEILQSVENYEKETD